MVTKLPRYVKSYPHFFEYIPFVKKWNGNALYPFIFLRSNIYQDLCKEKPSGRSIATLRHEEKHREHEIKMGWFMFAVRYLTSRKFRFEEELNAYKVTMKVFKENNIEFNTELAAKVLSGPHYFWSTSYKNAKVKLDEAWSNIMNT